MDQQQRNQTPQRAPQQHSRDFAASSRRSEQEAVLAINAVNPIAAAAHACLAVLHARRASGALGRAAARTSLSPAPLGEAGLQLRRAFPPIGPAAG